MKEEIPMGKTPGNYVKIPKVDLGLTSNKEVMDVAASIGSLIKKPIPKRL